MGLLDGIGAFVSMVLEACQVNPETREVLAAVERLAKTNHQIDISPMRRAGMPRTGCHGTHPKAGSRGIGHLPSPSAPRPRPPAMVVRPHLHGFRVRLGGAVPFCRSFCRVCS
uniref:Uncharacterized protein n=1 Tax=Ralstonia solanacearum TaxID=305 RepID=A0A0S4WCH3_RALSL|nr:protein of unknown function [Ralstonia solanacearum]